MSKQNIYDNDTFFTDFKKIRRNRVNFNDLLETPVLMKMLPDLKGRSVLDIGCGMGQHAMQYATLGAERVLGIDISAKMLAYARENNSAECITYRNMAMEDLDQIEDRFDVVTSSLVFDYIEDFEGLMKKNISSDERRCSARVQYITSDGNSVQWKISEIYQK